MAHFHPKRRKTLLNNLAELVAATALARHVHLAQIGDELPIDTSHEARIQWVRRQLDNSTHDSLKLFAPVVQALTAGWAGRWVRLILDPTDLSAELCMVQVALAYRGRALPIAWATVEIAPGTGPAAIRRLLAQVQTWLPADATVYLIADREFHGHDMLALIAEHNWVPVVRSKGRIQVELDSGCLADLAPASGHQAFYPRAWLTAWRWGPYSRSLANAPASRAGRRNQIPGTSSAPTRPVRRSCTGMPFALGWSRCFAI